MKQLNVYCADAPVVPYVLGIVIVFFFCIVPRCVAIVVACNRFGLADERVVPFRVERFADHLLEFLKLQAEEERHAEETLGIRHGLGQAAAPA